MKYLLLNSLLLCFYAQSWACSCFGPYQYDFFKVVKKSHQVYFGTVEKIDFSFTYMNRRAYTMSFKVKDTLYNCESWKGKTIIVTGQDGLNCGESMPQQWVSRHAVLALEKGIFYKYGLDSFYLHGCGAHYHFYDTQGPDDSATIRELKERIKNAPTSSSDIVDQILVLYPNPTTDHIVARWSGNTVEGISLLSPANAELFKFETNGKEFQEISLTNLPPGLYHILFSTENKRRRKSFIKL